MAFSGGGIRSASFNLGVLQALARNNWLNRFDYFSSVSGGGYIASWLGAWFTRTSAVEVHEALASDHCQIGKDSDWAKRRPIRFLRSYTNYLTPRRGLLSTDTWALLGIYLRNLLLNLAILTALLASLLLGAVLLVALSEWFVAGVKAKWAFSIMGASGVVLLVIPVVLIGKNLSYFFSENEEHKTPWSVRSTGIHVTIICPLLASAWLGGVFLSVLGAAFPATPVPTLYQWRYWMAFGAVAYGVFWLLAGIINSRFGSQSDGSFSWEWAIGSAFAAGAFGGVLLRTAALSAVFSRPAAIARMVSFGPPLLMLLFLITAVLHIGLMGLAFPDMKREWMARLGGLLLLFSGAWAGLFAIAVYDVLGLKSFWLNFLSTGSISATVQMQSFWTYAQSIAQLAGKLGLTGAWLAAAIGGAIAGRSPKTNGEQGTWNELLLRLAPFAFALGSFVAISLLIQTELPHIVRSMSQVPGVASKAFDEYLNGYWSITDVGKLALCLAATLAMALLLSLRVDVNDFSIHLLYRNRLVRCFLGASNTTRHPHPFTGFDPNDDVRLTALRNAGRQTYCGPYPILNATLNLVRGEELGWQKRKAAPFVFTPLFCGWDYIPKRGSEIGDQLDAAGYRLTDAYSCGRGAERGAISLGTAMAISGAAASPNMGYHSSPPVAFLMTLADVRLGWWAPNPANKRTWQSEGPKLGLLYLCREMFGLSDEKSGYVYLSDGGHFDNVGLYELVRRQCRFILACDASEDKDLRMQDLMNAIEKCRVDFGVEITIDVSGLKLDAASNQSKANCVEGTIKYGAGREGTLLYLKATRTGKEPEPIKAYAALDMDFPHHPTANQWFDESRFESYRSLGYFIADEMCRAQRGFPLGSKAAAATTQP